MAELAEILRKDSPENIVRQWHESQYSLRGYTGLSEIGHKCNRFLWYAKEGTPCPTPDGRILRLFRLGEYIEDQVISDLTNAGFNVTDQQKKIVFDFEGKSICGHIDGIITGLKESKKPHILEVKSASEKRFNQLKKVGYEKWSEPYKCQVHCYMLGAELDRALVWVENKNTSDSYTERIRLNSEYAVKRLQRMFKIMKQKHIPEGTCPRADWYEAKWCRYYETCFS